MMDTTKFKTRTMVKARDNGDSGEKWCVALDVGYSAVKVFSPNFVALFPSYAKKEEANFIGEIASDVILYKDLLTGDSWTVGEAAQESIDSRDTAESENTLYGRERYATPMFKVLVETGMGIGVLPSKTNSRGEREIFVQTGLPPKYLKTWFSVCRTGILPRCSMSPTSVRTSTSSRCSVPPGRLVL